MSICGTTGDLWSVKGGNKQIPKGLIRKSGANVISSRIDKIINITSNSSQPQYRLITLDGASKEYDVIVLAAPLSDRSKPVVNFESFNTNFDRLYRPYHLTLAYIVKGKPNYKYFGYESEEEMPSDIFPIGKSSFYNSLGTILSVQGDKPVYKVFSNQELTDAQLDILFLSRDVTELVPWLAYPEYSSDMEFVPFVLAPGFYFTNAIELSASAMEMSAIAGTNVANLIVHQWMDHSHLIDNMFVIEEKHIKIEL